MVTDHDFVVGYAMVRALSQLRCWGPLDKDVLADKMGFGPSDRALLYRALTVGVSCGKIRVDGDRRYVAVEVPGV